MDSTGRPEPVKVRFECRGCAQRTNHTILYETNTSDEEEVKERGRVLGRLAWGTRYRLLQCLGCEAVSFETASWFSEDIDEHGEPLLSIEVFPPRTSKVKFLDDDAWKYLPDNIYDAYQETVTAYTAGARLLTTIGLRSLVEAVCDERNAEGRDLFQKINSLVETGVMSRDQAAVLHNHRDLGNTAAHELTAPSPAELVALLEIVQHLLLVTYRVPFIAKMLEGDASPNRD